MSDKSDPQAQTVTTTTTTPAAPAMADTSKPHKDVPTSKRFLWGIGGSTDIMIYSGINGMVEQVYTVGMGIPPILVGLARSIPRFADLVIDPTIGHLSDNTRSRWGRRKPWMVAGALLSALIVILMWRPSMIFEGWFGMDQHKVLIEHFNLNLGGEKPFTMPDIAVVDAYVVLMMVILFTFGYSMFTIPHLAMGYEMSTDYNERTHLFKWRQYAYAAMGFLTPWLIPLCLKLEGDQSKVLRGVQGVQWVSIGIAALILLTAAAPIFGCRAGGTHQAEKKTRFFEGVRFALRNKAFWPLVLANFIVKFGMMVTGCFFFYVMVFHVSGGNNSLGTQRLAVFFNSINISTVLAMALMVKFTDIVGKKPAMLVLMLMSAVAYGSIWFTLTPHNSGWVWDVTQALSLQNAPDYVPGFLVTGWNLIADIWPAILTGIGIGVFTNSMPMIMNSMLADVCDVDELNSGHQRQAFYGAVFVTCDKLAMGVALLLQGVLLTASGFNSKLVLQSAETVDFWMKALLTSQPTAFLLGLCFILLYPITRARAKEVRHQLDLRKAAAQPPR